MALYLVVHHRQDPNQPWVNAWLDDNLLQAIQTTARIGRLCEAERRAWVFVHRCRCGNEPPSICCAVRVSAVSPLPGGGSLVQFVEPTRLDFPPPQQPVRGQNDYDAAPVVTLP